MTAITAPSHHAGNALATNRLGLWLFILSETFLFAALVSSRYYIDGVFRPQELNQVLGLAISMVLLLSSLTAYKAEIAAAHGDKSAYARNTVLTLALGGIFAVGVGMEWVEAFTFFPPQVAFGSIFFTLTGFHAFHVLSGLAILFIVYMRRRNTQQSGYWGVEGAVKYWHFVDVVWVVIYPTLYLVS